MAKRGENIHKRKDDRWEGRYIKRRTTDEKPIWGYLYGYAYGIVKDNLMKRKVPDWGEQTTLPFSQNDPRPQIFNHPRPTSDFHQTKKPVYHTQIAQYTGHSGYSLRHWYS